MSVDLEELFRFSKALINESEDDHFHTLGIQMLAITEKGVRMAMEYRPELVGDPDTGVIHGGAITSLLDTCCGFAAASGLDELGLTPTIDLRIDYMCSATPGETIYADAELYRSTEFVMFTRARAHHGDPDRPIACAVGTFFRLAPDVFEPLRARFKACTQEERNPVAGETGGEQ